MKGFTLLELLIVIVILIPLGVAGISSYHSFISQIKLNTAVPQIISTLHLSRDRTLASEGASSYGVHFEANKYVLFKGLSFNPSAVDNEEHKLPAEIEIYDISLGGGSDIVFDRIKGTTSNAGSVSIRIIRNPIKYKTISILSSGQAGLEGLVEPIGTRISDSRHLHFDLGWSIQNSTTLNLHFTDPPNPDVNFDIVMADYFDAQKSQFNWEGTMDVNGAIQTLKIHTHFLDPSNTLLCIHRDRRYNDKALSISIDSQGIVSYTQSGDPTVGAFGGIMEMQ